MSNLKATSTFSSLVVAFVAVIGLAGGAVWYVAAQTHKVEIQAVRLDSLAAKADQIPVIWNAMVDLDRRVSGLEGQVTFLVEEAELNKQWREDNQDFIELIREFLDTHGDAIAESEASSSVSEHGG